MLKLFLRRQKTLVDLSDIPHNEHRDPYLEHIMDELRLNKNNIPVTIKEQLKTKEVK